MRRGGVVGVAALLAGCVLATEPRAVSVSLPAATPDASLRVVAHEVRPTGEGPWPAVVLLHGCHGVSESTHAWARWLRARGTVALVVDSWTPRGTRDGCVPGPELPPTARLDDAIGALAWLHTRPYVDRTRVGVVGWSNGGVFAMSLVNGPSLERTRARGVQVPLPGFAAAVAFYPGGCSSLRDERVVRPLLVLIGEADDWTLAAECAEMVEAMRSRGADVTIVRYPGAFHYFDVEGQPRAWLPDVENRNRPGGCCGATVAYDAAAAADARRRVGEFFGYHLGVR
jgi:dienelactone hydrolase